MLKGNSIEFNNIVYDNVRRSFYLIYPIRNEAVETRLLECWEELVVALADFIVHSGWVEDPIKGRLNKVQFNNCVKLHIRILLLSLTPNLSRLVNTRVAEFLKHFNRFMLSHVNKWRSRDVNTRSRTIRAKAISKGSSTGNREGVVGG
jgi:hypothetical protein